MSKKDNVGELIDFGVLGSSVKQAEEMVEDDKVREQRKKQNEEWMKKNGVSVADMAGCMHKRMGR